MRAKRKLKYDSNALVGRALFVLGAVIGLIVAGIAATHQMDAVRARLVTGILSVVAGTFAPWPFVKCLATRYLVRARENLAAGAFHEAHEDACEAYRLLHETGPKLEAAQIRDAAHEQQRTAILDGAETSIAF